MMKNKGLLLIAGLLLFLLGFTSLVMQMVGVHWAFLQLLEIPGRLFAFVFKILMVVAGIISIVFARTDWKREREESL